CLVGRFPTLIRLLLAIDFQPQRVRLSCTPCAAWHSTVAAACRGAGIRLIFSRERISGLASVAEVVEERGSERRRFGPVRFSPLAKMDRNSPPPLSVPSRVPREQAMTTRAGLTVDPRLADFVETEALAGLQVTPAAFWKGLAALVEELGPKNRALLDKR